MANVGFDSHGKNNRHITLGDCEEGDIIYLETEEIFGLVIDVDLDERRIANLIYGNCEWYPNEIICRKFEGSIRFNINDFKEFL